MEINYIFAKEDVISCIVLLKELKDIISDTVDSNTEQQILDSLDERCCRSDIKLFQNIDNIWLDFENLKLKVD